MIDIITSYSDNRFQKFIDINTNNCHKLEYKYIVYKSSINDWWDGHTPESLGIIPCGCKPDIILNHMNNTGSKFVLWLDADAIITQKIDELLQYDIVCTPRRIGEYRNDLLRYTNIINAGFLLFHNVDEVRDLIKKWKLMVEIKCGDNIVDNDQAKFSNIVCDNPTNWIQSNIFVGPQEPYVIINGILVFYANPKIYNNYWNQFDTSSKIHHFKGGLKYNAINLERLRL